MLKLQIRQTQMAVLAGAFELTWLRGQLEALYPEECREMGPDRLAELVPAGVRRASARGFTSEDLLPYLALELSFGERFMDADWARQALPGDPMTKMSRLRTAAIFHLAELADREIRQAAADREAREAAEAEPELDVEATEDDTEATEG